MSVRKIPTAVMISKPDGSAFVTNVDLFFVGGATPADDTFEAVIKDPASAINGWKITMYRKEFRRVMESGEVVA